MIDSHCHLDARQFDKDREAVVDAAKKANVRLIINPASDFASNERIEKIAIAYRGYVLPCAGIDPISCLKENRIDGLEKYLDNCTAIGEVGLDYYWSKEKERQMENFGRLIDIARDYGKPLIIHAREAMKDTLDMLEKKHAELVILHCFSGDRLEAKRATDLGYYISFATNIVYRDSKSLIKDISLSIMLVETDSPYLSPNRSGRNEPKNVRLAIEEIAKAWELSFDELDRMTEKNTRKAFRL